MSQPIQTVVGIDVGGKAKGFHAVALRNSDFVDKTETTDPAVIIAWCRKQGATVVAVDAPCGWSQAGKSRLAERSLNIVNEPIHCFFPPMRNHALNNDVASTIGYSTVRDSTGY
jgi:predicted nuclease with RNAse H fold